MKDSVIIIESPNKVEKIKQLTGAEVYATIGHFTNLIGVDIENNFACKFEIKEDKAKKINFLINACRDKKVYIATDPDREGYGIGYQFYEKIKNVASEIYRAEFHEITPSGIEKGLKNAVLFSRSNTNLYQSFLGRIASDQVVGFALTSYLRKSLNLSELSAGRVQTPALALICQRDQEIRDFDKLDAEEKVEYQIQAKIVCNEKEVIIKHVRANEKNELVDFKFKDKNEASQFLKDLKDGLGSMSVLVSLKESLSNKEPKKPFTTSKLLSQASKSLKIPTKEIAQLAQKLFEAGLITYHRTDSEFLSPEYLKEHEVFFEPIYPSVYQYREYKAGKNSQAEAHEAIRITHPHVLKDLEKVCSDAKISEELALKLYQLIYANTICSQSRNALYNQYDCIFKIKSESFKLSFKLLKEKGFLEIEELIQGKEELNKEEQESEIENFSLKENDSVPLKEVFIKKIEKPSPKPYKESAFIPLLESEGIGRPSTYASFLDLLLKRKYISIDTKTNAITPTSQGLEVISFFKKDKEVDFIALTSKDKSKLGSTTKQFEECLDLIMRGEASYEKFMLEVISKLKSTAKFYQAQSADNNMPTDKQLELIDKICKDKKLQKPSQEILQNKEKCSDWIAEHVKEKPSQKQLNLVKKICEECKLAMPTNKILNDKFAISKWIDEHKKTKK
ncbi:type IA DNA topoisomerase [Helicobacter pylori]|uniref:type IA DNA topoisomerase n=1 Tax=Helicobacter pylori TaxID=210 RepID=UPI000EAE71C9|nr:type IA DNA topoisomerase [Helicobacter pylori]